MSTSITFNRISADLMVIQATGPLTEERARAAIEEFYAGDPTRGLIWDLRQADLTAFSTDQILATIKLAMGFSHHREGGRSALVVGEDLAFGLSRMYQNWAEAQNHPIPHGVFRDLDQARAWVEAQED